MTEFDESDVKRDEDTITWRNRMKVTSPDSGKTYTISQRTTDLVWACSCWSWRTSQPNPCKHLRALGLISGKDEPAQVVIDRIGELRWTVQQLRAKVDGPPRAKKPKDERVSSKRASRGRSVQDVRDEQTQAIMRRTATSRQPPRAAHSHASRAARLACPECRQKSPESPSSASPSPARQSPVIAGSSIQASSSATSASPLNIGRALTLSIVEDTTFDLLRSQCELHGIDSGELALILFRLTGRLRGAP